MSPFLKMTAGYLHAAFLKNALSSAGARSAAASCTFGHDEESENQRKRESVESDQRNKGSENQRISQLSIDQRKVPTGTRTGAHHCADTAWRGRRPKVRDTRRVAAQQHLQDLVPDWLATSILAVKRPLSPPLLRSCSEV